MNMIITAAAATNPNDTAAANIIDSDNLIYFDESIFDDGFSLRNYEVIVVNNRADKMLASRLLSNGRQQQHSYRVLEHSCETLKSETSSIPHDRIVSLNPKIPCIGTNVYTLNSRNKRVAISLPYHLPIVVTIKSHDTDDTFSKLSIDEYANIDVSPIRNNDNDDDDSNDDDDIYDDRVAKEEQLQDNVLKLDMNQDLKPIESAIMIKYLALKRSLVITMELFLYINKYYVDHRQWFTFDDSVGVIENRNHELLLNRKPIDLPRFLNFSGPELIFS